MKAVRLTLICHALTQSQKVGRFHAVDEAILPVGHWPAAAEPGIRILSAPEPRALQTAIGLGATPAIEPALADVDLGAWQGLALKHLQAEAPEALEQWLQDPRCAPHGGESIGELCQRIAAWLEAFDGPGETWAVTHPQVIRAALVHVLGSPLAGFQHIDVLPLARLQLSRAGQWRLRLG
ncbi:histidine phosphatase family protein [Pseudomonas guariconensis]|uniref:histidine phosphatase family protein n=1 Tax=Pseudomonas guariconensis TaxID=1288410 RepID=UPI0018AB986A|nr:histidine phosphatase family protein [Pseudomonas guariconensis]MBF8740309.1 histidine phosphatase family protein [Pseudomonas guariconensis]MBF8750452.1 histidine phosphatase family protein [Pseudomonas guariconensis]